MGDTGQVDDQSFGKAWPGDGLDDQQPDVSAGADGVGFDSEEGYPVGVAEGERLMTGVEHEPPAETASDEATCPAVADARAHPGEEPTPAHRPTGRDDVDTILDRLAELDGLPPSEHVHIYEDAHRRLHETLAAAGEDHEDPPRTS